MLMQSLCSLGVVPSGQYVVTCSMPLFTVQDKVDTIRGMCIGISAHQKLELLTHLVRLLGYESLSVFGDCFDEVSIRGVLGSPCFMPSVTQGPCAAPVCFDKLGLATC